MRIKLENIKFSSFFANNRREEIWEREGSEIMSDEKLRILNMLKEGKISVERANELLESLNLNSEREFKKSNYRFLKILVEGDGDNNINISIPYSLAKTVLNLIPWNIQKILNEQNINIDELLNNEDRDDNEPLILVNINDGNKHLIIKLE
jgi:predicted PilT family ATPase